MIVLLATDIAELCQLAVHVQSAAQIAALHQEKQTQLQQCGDLRQELQQQLQHIQHMLLQLGNKEAHLEFTCKHYIECLEAQAATSLKQ